MPYNFNPNPAPHALLGSLIAAVLLCSGCSSHYNWPDHGHSGVAETRPHLVHWHYERHQLDHIALEIAEARRDIHLLRHHGLKTYHPALLHEINDYYTLTERELEGHFYRDAEKNLRILQDLIKEAQTKMDERVT